MQHIEFTQQAPDDVQFYFQGWHSQRSRPKLSSAWCTAWASTADAAPTSPRR